MEYIVKRSCGSPRHTRWSRTAAVLLLIICACDRGSTHSLPNAMLGQWHYDGSTGGIDGRRNSNDATGYIVIGSDNTITSYSDDGSLISRAAFAAAPERTIYATEELWVIRPEQGEPEVIILSDDGQTLSFSPNAYDAVGRIYVRSP